MSFKKLGSVARLGFRSSVSILGSAFQSGYGSKTVAGGFRLGGVGGAPFLADDCGRFGVSETAESGVGGEARGAAINRKRPRTMQDGVSPWGLGRGLPLGLEHGLGQCAVVSCVSAGEIGRRVCGPGTQPL